MISPYYTYMTDRISPRDGEETQNDMGKVKSPVRSAEFGAGGHGSGETLKAYKVLQNATIYTRSNI